MGTQHFSVIFFKLWRVKNAGYAVKIQWTCSPCSTWHLRVMCTSKLRSGNSVERGSWEFGVSEHPDFESGFYGSGKPRFLKVSLLGLKAWRCHSMDHVNSRSHSFGQKNNCDSFPPYFSFTIWHISKCSHLFQGRTPLFFPLANPAGLEPFPLLVQSLACPGACTDGPVAKRLGEPLGWLLLDQTQRWTNMT